jgi:hypothetical protein
MEQQRLPCSKIFLDNPQGETGQAGFSLDSREEYSPRVNSPKTKSQPPESLHGLEQDFGDIRNTS